MAAAAAAAAAAERDRIAQRLQSELDPALARMRPVGGGKNAAYVPSEMLIEQAKCVAAGRPPRKHARAVGANVRSPRARSSGKNARSPRARHRTRQARAPRVL